MWFGFKEESLVHKCIEDGITAHFLKTDDILTQSNNFKLETQDEVKETHVQE